MVKKYYNPRPSAITQRFKFNSHVRQPGETVAKYVAELHKLSEHCNFKDTPEEMLWDRLVWSIADPHGESLVSRRQADLHEGTGADPSHGASSKDTKES